MSALLTPEEALSIWRANRNRWNDASEDPKAAHAVARAQLAAAREAVQNVRTPTVIADDRDRGGAYGQGWLAAQGAILAALSDAGV